MTAQDVLDALEGDDEGVRPAKEHYRGNVQCVHQGVSHMALIFASSILLSILDHDCTYVFADGTFKTAPRPFTQVFNILISYKGVVLPVFHILMTGKPYGLYQKVFNRLANLFPKFKPVFINTDFEGAMFKAIKKTFPRAMTTGCWFHYCKAVLRAINGPSKCYNFFSPFIHIEVISFF